MIFETGKKYRTTWGSITQDGVTTSRIYDAYYHGPAEHDGKKYHVFLYILEDGLLMAHAWVDEHIKQVCWEAV